MEYPRNAGSTFLLPYFLPPSYQTPRAGLEYFSFDLGEHARQDVLHSVQRLFVFWSGHVRVKIC